MLIGRLLNTASFPGKSAGALCRSFLGSPFLSDTVFLGILAAAVSQLLATSLQLGASAVFHLVLLPCARSLQGLKAVSWGSYRGHLFASCGPEITILRCLMSMVLKTVVLYSSSDFLVVSGGRINPGGSFLK